MKSRKRRVEWRKIKFPSSRFRVSILASKQVSSQPQAAGEEPEKTRLLHGRFSWEKKTICSVVIIMMKMAIGARSRKKKRTKGRPYHVLFVQERGMHACIHKCAFVSSLSDPFPPQTKRKRGRSQDIARPVHSRELRFDGDIELVLLTIQISGRVVCTRRSSCAGSLAFGGGRPFAGGLKRESKKVWVRFIFIDDALLGKGSRIFGNFLPSGARTH